MRIVKPQVVGLSVCILTSMEFSQNNGCPVRWKPHIKVVNRAVGPDSLRHGGVMGPSIHHVNRLKVERLCSAPNDPLKRDAAYSSSSYTGRIQKLRARDNL